MRVVKTINALREEITAVKRKQQSIGFVPTMGYLHEGHMSLIEEARRQHDIVVLSIFVNPLQFGPNEDLERYPRDFVRDENIAKELGVDLLFYPDTKEMYPADPSMTIHVTEGVNVLCGKSRPGHFDGVTTVVMKLFMLVQPDQAYFGQKDAQQVAIITNMVDMFNIPVEVIPCPTVREEDGLAKSSRNVYLTDEERQEAPLIYQVLTQARSLIKEGELSPSEIVQFVKKELNSLQHAKMDYVELLTYPKLMPVTEKDKTILLAVAYIFKHARLIDNIIVSKGE
ncbi:pantoate--beta-alanine ligase [Alkalihalophilus pseudofirmus]|uniref:pantoate--beta-alanine ligase n=1 Tax=Alkalihalophilus pseudofirmus TaxID=79885 RepID=UPI000952B658|nr:pantoate--beta-alanine ligase [Alkalihalophilus pseudofirmus]